MRNAALMVLILVFAPVIWAHHMAPVDMQDFIEDQLIEVDSLHLESSDEDPSLLDTVTTTLDDLDYAVVAYGLDDDAVIEAVDDILQMLDDGNQVLDDSFTIEQEADGTYTLTITVDFYGL